MRFFIRPELRLEYQKSPAVLRPIGDLDGGVAVFPLAHERGRPLKFDIRPGDVVPKFSTIAYPPDDTYDDCGLLMPFSGRVLEIKEIDHPALGRVPAAVLEPDKGVNPRVTVSYDAGYLTADELLALAKMSCIIDSLDGVSLYSKLKALKENTADLMVVDCIEDQTFSSALIRQLIEQGEEMAAGALYALRAAGRRLGKVKIACNLKVRGKIKKEYKGAPVEFVKGGYPLRDRLEDRFGKSFAAVGGAALADFYRFLSYGQGQTSTVVTVAGNCVKNPANVRVPIGTTIWSLLKHCGLSDEPEVVVLGDALTGAAVTDLSAPVTPHVRAVLALTRKKERVVSCIGCGRCIWVCHKKLMPNAIYSDLERGNRKGAAAFGAEECDLCGACSYVCPSKLGLAHTFETFLKS